jgi:FAD/FMN-containing dehydrogenase
MNANAKTIDDQLVIIDDKQLDELGARIKGAVIRKENPLYDPVRKIWNAMVNTQPAFIVQCTGKADVIQAVRFAKEHKLLISVRGGGHNIAGRSLQENVMLIDLSRMTSVHVDPENNTVTVDPGATLRDLDHETQAFGLAVPVGINSTTGIAGLTLGGGFGWLSRKLGLTIDNLISAEVITIDGKRIICDAHHHPDLFWAIRGGGGNFGIVTSFKFRLHRTGPELMCGPVIFPIEEAKKVLQRYNDFCKQAPEELSVWAVLRHAPPFPFLDASFHGKPVLILVCVYNGTIEDGKKEIARVKELGHAIGDAVSPHLFEQFQQAFDALLTPGARNYWKTHNFITLNDELIDRIVESATQLPSTQSEIFIAQVGGTVNRIGQDATAYPHRNIEFIMNVHTRWEEADQDNECVSWARDFYRSTKPFATGGAYVNFVSQGDDDLQNVYGENIKRLSAVKAEYDPLNHFRTNLNITPAVTKK